MEYYSAIKRYEALIYAKTGIKLEIIMLSERSQTQKAMYYMIPLYKSSKNRQIQSYKVD